MKIKKITFLAFGFILLSAIANATFTSHSASFSQSNALPKGYHKALVGSLYFTTDIKTDSIHSISILNTGTAPFGPQDVSKVELFYLDDGMQAEQPMAQLSFSTKAPGCTFTGLSGGTFSDALPNKTIKIYYTIADDATLGTTANFTLDKVNVIQGGLAATLDMGLSSGKDFPVTGMDASLDPLYTPKVVVPGGSKVPFAYFSFTPRGESFDGKFKMLLRSEGASGDDTYPGNFDFGALNQGIVKAYIYLDTANIGVFDSTPTGDQQLISLQAADMKSRDELEIDSSFGYLAKNTTMNMFVVFDIGSKTEIGGGRKLNFQIKSFSAEGSDSNLYADLLNGLTSRSLPQSAQDDRYSSMFGGLHLDAYHSIVPSGNIGKGLGDIPVAWFVLSAQELGITVNELTIANTGNIPYVQDVNQKSGVTLISLYKDTDNDGFFNGANHEELISSWPLGSINSHGVGNSTSVLNLTGLHIFIPTTNWHISMLDGEKAVTQRRFFLVYDLGDTIPLSGISSNAFTSNLPNAAAVSAIIPQNILLSGATNSYQIVVNVNTTNILITGVKSISVSTPTAYEQSFGVPVLQYDLESTVDLDKVQVSVLSNTGGFLNSDKGVSAVKLFRDTGNGYFDVSDLVEGKILKYDNANTIKLPPVMLKAAVPVRFFVVMDTGASAVGSFPFQVSNITSTSDVAGVVPSALFPLPINPVFLSVTDNNVAISALTSSANTVSAYKLYFVNISVKNNNPYAVTLNSVVPKFYKDSISGVDLSSEYSIVNATMPVALNANSSTTFSFAVSTNALRTSGVVFVDALVDYSSAFLSQNATVLRHKDYSSALVPAAPNNMYWTAVAPNQPTYALPAYIQSITEQGSTKNLFDKDVTQKGLSIEIQFVNAGTDIAGDSILLYLNGQRLTQDTTSQNYYAYAVSTGKLTLKIAQAGPCALLLKVKDLFGNDLESLNLNLTVYDSNSLQVAIQNLYVYPTPYNSAASSLKIGYTLLGPATIKFYLVDMMGQIIWKHEDIKTAQGSFIYDFDGIRDDGRRLSTGAYILYAVAENESGNKSKTKTKLAVW